MTEPLLGPVWPLSRPVRPALRGVLLLSGLSALATLAALYGLGSTAALLAAGQSSPWPLLWAAAGATAVAFVARLAAFALGHFAAFRLERTLRERLTTHLAHLSPGQVDQHGSGALTGILHDDVAALHAFVADTTPVIGRSLVLPLATLLLLLGIDLWLAGTALLLAGVGLWAARQAWGGDTALLQRYQQANADVHRRVVEFAQAMPVVRTFDSGSNSFSRYQQALDEFRTVLAQWLHQSGRPARLSLLLLSPLPTLVGLAVVGGLRLAQGELDALSWGLALLIGTGIVDSLMPLMMLQHFLLRANQSAQRIQSLLDEPPLPAGSRTAPPDHSGLQLQQVSFRYPGAARPALQALTASLPAGRLTAVVGRSGSGKSTLIRLLARDMDVDKGCILLGSTDLRDFAVDTLTQQVSCVFQDNVLFPDSVLDNLRLGAPDADAAAVRAAARQAWAAAFIQALPQGYQTPLGDRGLALSGGQRQRLALARALLQARPILLLDEPTAYADAETDAAVSAMLKHCTGITRVLVAHRLNSVVEADQILVLDQGRLVQQGCHQDLVEAPGLYRTLWQHHQQAQSWQLRTAPADPPLPASRSKVL